MTNTINIKIEGYKASTLSFFHNYNGVDVYTGKVVKVNGKKEFHTTLRVGSSLKVFTIENLKNIEHANFNIS